MPLFLTKGWILISVWASLVGWSLALSGHLNRPSYVTALIPLGFFLVLLHRKAEGRLSKILFAPLRYFRHLLNAPCRTFSWPPVLFISVALLSFLGGILFSPSNYDALSYRFPRMLHWLDAHRWHWIDTPNTRQNYSAPGFEWLTMPLFVFFKSDRLFFIVNWCSFLLLPTLLFRAFRLAGLSQKTCWCWMWLLPLAYGYVLQSGSIGNDAFTAVYALASVGFVLSGDRQGRFFDFVWGLLSVALLTGAKASNLPLALPWLVAMLWRYPVWFPRMTKLLPWIIVALGVSFVPIAVLNHQHTGSWNGDPANRGKMNLSTPTAGLLGNSLMLAYYTLQPPLLSSPSKVNDFATRLIPPEMKIWLLERFPRFELKMGEIPMEESAGLGLGLVSCLFLWIFLGRRASFPFFSLRARPWFLLGTAGILSLLFFMAKMGSESTARLLLPYYPFLFLLPLGFWSWTGMHVRKLTPLFALLCSTILIGLIFNPARPLFPVQKLLPLTGDHPKPSRIREVYQTYRQRNNCWDPILTILPPDVQRLGIFSNGNDLEAPLWKPWGLRTILSVDEKDLPTQNLPQAQAWLARRPVAEFLKSHSGRNQHWVEAGSQFITQRVSAGEEEWAILLPR